MLLGLSLAGRLLSLCCPKSEVALRHLCPFPPYKWTPAHLRTIAPGSLNREPSIFTKHGSVVSITLGCRTGCPSLSSPTAAPAGGVFQFHCIRYSAVGPYPSYRPPPLVQDSILPMAGLVAISILLNQPNRCGRRCRTRVLSSRWHLNVWISAATLCPVPSSSKFPLDSSDFFFCRERSSTEYQNGNTPRASRGRAGRRSKSGIPGCGHPPAPASPGRSPTSEVSRLLLCSRRWQSS